jgi:hypothetical protein
VTCAHQFVNGRGPCIHCGLSPLLASIETGNALRAELATLRQAMAAVRPLLAACEAVPDLTLSQWACSPGPHWEPVRAAIKAARQAAGLDLDGPPEAFDWSTGRLRSRGD